jgi:hypothetical protein
VDNCIDDEINTYRTINVGLNKRLVNGVFTPLDSAGHPLSTPSYNLFEGEAQTFVLGISGDKQLAFRGFSALALTLHLSRFY